MVFFQILIITVSLSSNWRIYQINFLSFSCLWFIFLEWSGWDISTNKWANSLYLVRKEKSNFYTVPIQSIKCIVCQLLVNHGTRTVGNYKEISFHKIPSSTALFPKPSLNWSVSKLPVDQCANENADSENSNISSCCPTSPWVEKAHHLRWYWNYTSINVAFSLYS